MEIHEVFYGCDCSNSSNTLTVRVDEAKFRALDKIYCLVLLDNQELYFKTQDEIEYYCKINNVDVANKERMEIEGASLESEFDMYILTDCEMWYEYDEEDNEY